MAPSRRFDAVIFDLDGTLLDSVRDIAEAGNHAMRTVGRPTFPVADYNRLAGQGLPALIRDALGPDHPDLFDAAIAAHTAHYAEHGTTHTRPFPGVPELLDTLRAAGLRRAILSNKPHDATVDVVARLLPDTPFDAVVGHRPPTPTNPDPTSALALAQTLGVEPSAVAYIGDTAADMQTAVNAGFHPIGVTWGFRDAAELQSTGAAELASDIDALRNLLLP